MCGIGRADLQPGTRIGYDAGERPGTGEAQVEARGSPKERAMNTKPCVSGAMLLTARCSRVTPAPGHKNHSGPIGGASRWIPGARLIPSTPPPVERYN